MTESKSPIDVVDTSGLTDADWAEINKLRAAYENGGQKALSRALQELATDPIRYTRVMGAIFPDTMREAVKDQMAAMGITEEELQDLLKKLASLQSH